MAHILVVEDDDSMRHAIAQAVSVMGHRPSQARDGRECLAVHQADPCDVVVTDIVMPEKDGLGLIYDLRKQTPSVRIVAISGGGLVPAREYLRIAKGMGAAAVLEKPFVARQLTTIIADLLKDGTVAAPA